MSTSIKKKQSQFPAIIREVEDRIVMVRGMEVIADADVAALYGVETKHVNQAVHNNPDKFPSSYMFELNMTELQNLRSKFLTTNVSAMNRNPTKVFTERGLYMLATILSGERARNVTFAIIETFYKVRSMKRELLELHNESDKEVQNENRKSEAFSQTHSKRKITSNGKQYGQKRAALFIVYGKTRDIHIYPPHPPGMAGDGCSGV